MLGSDEGERKRVGRLLWGPVAWLLLFYSGGIAIVTVMFYLAPAAIETGFFVLLAFVYFTYFWIALYMVVELQLWRRMGNLGHLLQFLGSLLILAPILWSFLPLLLGGLSIGVGPIWLLVLSVQEVAWPVGLVMVLYGHYHRDYHASDVDMYRNVVVRAGEGVSALTDGYSTRVYETRYESFPGPAVAAKADEYAVRFQKGGFFLAHRTDDKGITLYPVTYTGVGGLRVRTVFRHLLRLAHKPEELTWVRVDWTGAARVHISPEDYRRIKRPVAHHTLCAGVADAVVGSLLAYANEQETAAVASLLGPERTYPPQALRLPTPVQDRSARLVILATAILLVTGTGVGLAGWLVAQSPVWISNVRWSPQNPGPGNTIEISATIVNLGSSSSFLPGPAVYYWAYFNDTTNGSVSLANIQGSDYRVSIGPFHDGTEVTFVVAQELQATLSAWLVQSHAFVIDIGKVQRGGSSGLTIGGITVPDATHLYAAPSAWINSSAQVTDARLLVTGVFGYTTAYGGGGGSWGLAELPLAPAGSFYSWHSLIGDIVGDPIHMRATLDLRFVAKDASGNTATSAFIVVQIDF